jgi:hypothetical protein
MKASQLLVIALWGLAAYLWRPSALRRGEWRTRLGLQTRLFVILLAAGITLLGPVGPVFDRSLGLPDVSWLCGYMLSLAGAYFGLSIWLVMRGQASWPSALITALAEVLLAVSYAPLARGPELNLAKPATTVAVLALHMIVYLVLLYMTWKVSRILIDMARREQLPTGHLRLSIMLLAVGAGGLFCLLRILGSLIELAQPSWPFANALYSLGDMFIALCMAGFALSLVPLRWLRVGARVGIYLEQQWAIWELRGIRNDLVAVTTPLPWEQPGWRQRLTELSYALYCLLIDILDRRTLLQAEVAGGIRLAPPALRGILGDLPETQDWVELLQHVRRVSRSAARPA